MKFLFDLDGTVTSKETLPIIAEHFGVQDQIAELTHHTVQGNVPFVESFIRRVNILGRFSVSEISDLLARVPLYPLVSKFIKENQSDCIIVTGNLDCWCEGLYKKIGCQCYGSEAEVENDHIVKLENILRKEQSLINTEHLVKQSYLSEMAIMTLKPCVMQIFLLQQG